MKPRDLSLAILIGLLSRGVSAQAPLPATRTQVAWADAATGLTFPTRLGGLDFQAREAFEQPGMGYCLRYADTSMKADVYVYDMDRPGIADGIVSPAVHEELSNATASIEAMVETGRYRDAKLVAQGVSSDSGPINFAWLMYNLHPAMGKGDPPGPYISQVLLTGYHLKFVKVRITAPEGHDPKASRPGAAFVAALATLMASKESASLHFPPLDPSHKRLPSTPGQRRKFVELVCLLDEDPTRPGSDELRRELIKFIEDAPDLVVNLHADMLGEVGLSRKHPVGTILFAQYIVSVARGLIEIPHCDEVAAQTSGLQGALRGYAALKRLRPGLVVNALEELTRTSAAGRLREHVVAVLKNSSKTGGR